MAKGTTDQGWLRDAAKLLASLPPAPQPVTPPETQTCVCGKQVTIDKLAALNTGVFITSSDVCKGCKDGEEYDKKHARLVCVKCKRVLMHIPPAVDKTGFRFEANKTYHVNGCGQCIAMKLEEGSVKEKEFMVIEKTVWNRKHGIGPQNKNTEIET